MNFSPSTQPKGRKKSCPGFLRNQIYIALHNFFSPSEFGLMFAFTFFCYRRKKTVELSVLEGNKSIKTGSFYFFFVLPGFVHKIGLVDDARVGSAKATATSFFLWGREKLPTLNKFIVALKMKTNGDVVMEDIGWKKSFPLQLADGGR
jgi:hypothetical protein